MGLVEEGQAKLYYKSGLNKGKLALLCEELRGTWCQGKPLQHHGQGVAPCNTFLLENGVTGFPLVWLSAGSSSYKQAAHHVPAQGIDNLVGAAMGGSEPVHSGGHQISS